MSKNGDKEENVLELEHQKTMIEVMEGTRSSVEGYAAAQNILEGKAALILILNELRCIHWHFDQAMAKDEVKDSVPPVR